MVYYHLRKLEIKIHINSNKGTYTYLYKIYLLFQVPYIDIDSSISSHICEDYILFTTLRNAGHPIYMFHDYSQLCQNLSIQQPYYIFKTTYSLICHPLLHILSYFPTSPSILSKLVFCCLLLYTGLPTSSKNTEARANC